MIILTERKRDTDFIISISSILSIDKYYDIYRSSLPSSLPVASVSSVLRDYDQESSEDQSSRPEINGNHVVLVQDIFAPNYTGHIVRKTLNAFNNTYIIANTDDKRRESFCEVSPYKHSLSSNENVTYMHSEHTV